MTPVPWNARAIAAAALILSTAAHAVVLAGLSAPADEVEAGAGQAAALPLIGNGFADLAEGTARPVAPSAAAEAPHDVLAPLSPAQDTARPVPSAVTPVAAEMAPAVDDDAVPAAPMPAPERIAARLEDAPATSPRPEPRRPDEAKRAAKEKKAVHPPSAVGNADRNQTKGAATDNRQGTAAQAGKGKAAATDGGAAVSKASYGTAVMRKIRATPLRKIAGRGSATVGFDISASGALGRVRILTSSGSAVLDAGAIDHIRRAAPFPPPPGGSARFSFEFAGRG